MSDWTTLVSADELHAALALRKARIQRNTECKGDGSDENRTPTRGIGTFAEGKNSQTAEDRQPNQNTEKRHRHHAATLISQASKRMRPMIMAKAY